MILTTVLTSIAQILYKFGVPKLSLNFYALITNYPIILGIALYALGAVVMITALKGGEVTVLYPIIATSYIWVSIMSMIFFKEAMPPFKWLGVFVIVAGIIIISVGSKNTDAIEYFEGV